MVARLARRRRRLPRFASLAILILAVGVAAPSLADHPTEAEESEPATSAPSADAIPIPSIIIQASNVGFFIAEIEPTLATPPRQTEIAERLRESERSIHARARLLDTSLDDVHGRGEIDTAYALWSGIVAQLDRWAATLASRLDKLDEIQAELSQRSAVWTATALAAREQRAPSELHAVIAGAQAQLNAAAEALRSSRDRALDLQRRVVALDALAQSRLERIDAAREGSLRNALHRRGAPIWNVDLAQIESNLEIFRHAQIEGWDQLTQYLAQNRERLALQILLTLALGWLAWRSRRDLLAQPLGEATRLPRSLEHPVAATLVLGLTATTWLHPQAPPQLTHAAVIIVMPFWYVVLRNLLPDSLRGPLIGFLVLSVFELMRQFAVGLRGIAYLLLVAEIAGYLLGIAWLRRPARISLIPVSARSGWTRLLGAWLHMSLVAMVIGLVAGLAGWTSLADLALIVVARGSFFGSVLFAAVCVVEDLVEAALRSGQARRIRTIDRAPYAFRRIVSRSARAIGLISWVSVVLQLLAVRGLLAETLDDVFSAPIGYGNVHVTLGGIVAFAVTIWISWLGSRLIAALLEGEVFTRFLLPRGVPFAISSISRYIVLVLGFVAAIAALGVDVGNVALLVSALGVGIGFGLQNVVNNFISGLILLFERPIKVGDIVVLGTLFGTVQQIGIRASVVRTFDGADTVVPNGDLISNQLTNWTLADTRRRITIPLGVAYGTPAPRVIELLLEVARADADVLTDPEPMALFVGFGDSSLDFELRAWTESLDALTLVRSRLAVAIQAALAEAGVEVPFPQRDLHIKTLPDTGERDPHEGPGAP